MVCGLLDLPGLSEGCVSRLEAGRGRYDTRKVQCSSIQGRRFGAGHNCFDINIGSGQIPILVAQFRAMGYTLSTAGQITTASGPEVAFYFRVVDSEPPRSIAVHFSLNRTKEGQQGYIFPDSELRFYSDRTAIWTFPGAWRKNH